jgi:AP-1 complex subunit gamma-1
LNHANQYVVGLALCAVANISSPEIARDASSDVQKLLGSSNPYLRKKVPKALPISSLSLSLLGPATN